MDSKLIAVVALVTLSVHATLASNPVVEIGESTFKGTRKTYNYAGIVDAINTVDSYLGVPYAKSPVGDRRFKDPEDVDRGVNHDGTKLGPTCVQEDSATYSVVEEANLEGEVINEDCLRLNIYTPYKAGSNSYPVMVYIHGGSLRVGSGNWFDGHVLAQHGVVVVTINYRVGSFGFMGNGKKSELPGDYGIYDQVLALRWIKNNIGSFRGNPSEVTIFGNSAGGWSVNLHLMMAESKDLFHRAVIQSGPLEGKGNYHRSGTEPNQFFQFMATNLNCTGNWQDKATCMRGVDADAVLKVETTNLQNYKSLWKGSRVLPNDPAALIRSGHINKVPVIIGTTAAETARFLCIYAMSKTVNVTTDGIFVGTNPSGPATESDLSISVKNMMKIVSDLDLTSKQLTDIVKKYFPVGIRSDRKKVTATLVEIESDVLMEVPSIRLARMLQSKGVPTYFYTFDNPLAMNVKYTEDREMYDTSQYLQNYCKWLSDYSYHETELPILFGVPISGGNSKSVWHISNYSAQDKHLSLSMMKLWTDFAKNGNPTPKGASNIWAEFNGRANNHLNIKHGSRLLMTRNSEKLNKVKFWEDMLPEVFPRQ